MFTIFVYKVEGEIIRSEKEARIQMRRLEERERLSYFGDWETRKLSGHAKKVPFWFELKR